MAYSRLERSLLANWWWTVDRALLGVLVLLVFLGIILSLAASPAVAERLGYSTFHFVNRQVFFALSGLPILFVASLLNPRWIRRGALLLYVVMFALVIATLLFGVEIKGARRWFNVPGMGTVQPSEFIKPAFIILSAWLLSEGATKRGVPGTFLAMLLLVMTLLPLVLQPDMGQTFLLLMVWMALFFMVGVHWFWVFGGVFALGGLVYVAYHVHPHFAERINNFLDPASGDTFQVDTALDAIVTGSWFGKGPGEGTVKRIVPDAHTDFIFAVTAEEFGVVFALVLVALFAFVVLRSLMHARVAQDGFVRLAVSGLALLFGLQASINIMVNLQLMPAKGMTLPFISYGGSSLWSLAYSVGMLLALTRRRPVA